MYVTVPFSNLLDWQPNPQIMTFRASARFEVYAMGSGRQLLEHQIEADHGWLLRHYSLGLPYSLISTEYVYDVISVADLTRDGDVEIILSASVLDATPPLPPDWLYQEPVGITATLECMEGERVAITTATPDVVVPTNGDSSYYSIPRIGEVNHSQRQYTLGIEKPANSTVDEVSVDLRVGNNEVRVLDEGIGAAVREISPTQLAVRVTWQGASSTLVTTPPPARSLSYRFRLKVRLQDGTLAEAQRDSDLRNALWRMPNGLARYGVRDPGGDDWTSERGYSWIDANRGHLTSIDDVSGEHARDIEHRSHFRGTDLDIFHFYTFPGAISGLSNYELLRDDVVAAFTGNQAARDRVRAWVAATRAGLDQLLALNTVARLYYAVGSPHATEITVTGVTIPLSLPHGWARELLQTGIVTSGAGQGLNIGSGPWGNAASQKTSYNSVHNSHIHVDLNDSLL